MSWINVSRGDGNSTQYTVAAVDSLLDGIYYEPELGLWRWKAVQNNNHSLLHGKYVISSQLGYNLQVDGLAVFKADGQYGTDENIKTIYHNDDYYKHAIYFSHVLNDYVLSEGVDVQLSEYMDGTGVFHGDRWYYSIVTNNLLNSTQFIPRGQLNVSPYTKLNFNFVAPSEYYVSDTPFGQYQKVQGTKGDYIQFGVLVLKDNRNTTYTQQLRGANTYSGFSGMTLVDQTPSYRISDSAYPAGYWTFSGRLPKVSGETATFVRHWTDTNNADPNSGNLTVSVSTYTYSNELKETYKTFGISLWH